MRCGPSARDGLKNFDHELLQAVSASRVLARAQLTFPRLKLLPQLPTESLVKTRKHYQRRREMRLGVANAGG